MVESSETNNIDLEAYCTHEIRRHEPSSDSPFLSGAIAGRWLRLAVTYC